MRTDRITIEYDLIFKTLFHCGTGIREGLIDRTVVRDSAGYLYVPGSTFKGVLREHCEHLARFYQPESIASPHNAKAALLEIGNGKRSMITRIFGSQAVPGKLFFDDARQEDLKPYDDGEEDGEKGKYKSLQVIPYTQVRLDRPTRTAVPGALYTSEFGASDIVFKGSIQGWLECSPISSSDSTGSAPLTYCFLLLLGGLHMIERLGGNKSTGKGHCTCKITKVILNGTEYKQETVWHGWLEQLDELTYYNLLMEG